MEIRDVQYQGMRKADLLDALINCVSADERRALEKGEEGLAVSRYNRATLLRMLGMQGSAEGLKARIDGARAKELADALSAYLGRFMADRPQGHKWIVLSCLFLAFVAEEPMHPREIVHWEKRGNGYACPVRDASGDSLCRWCACRAGGDAGDT